MSTHSEKYALLFSMTSEIRHSGASPQTAFTPKSSIRSHGPFWIGGAPKCVCRLA